MYQRSKEIQRLSIQFHFFAMDGFVQFFLENNPVMMALASLVFKTSLHGSRKK